MSKPSGRVPPFAANTGLSETTRAVRAGIECDDATGAVVPPLHLTSTFAFKGLGEKRRYDYTRSGNPTRDLLAQALADWSRAPARSSPQAAWQPSRSPGTWCRWAGGSSPARLLQWHYRLDA
jgi:hypothetical protein